MYNDSPVDESPIKQETTTQTIKKSTSALFYPPSTLTGETLSTTTSENSSILQMQMESLQALQQHHSQQQQSLQQQHSFQQQYAIQQQLNYQQYQQHHFQQPQQFQSFPRPMQMQPHISSLPYQQQQVPLQIKSPYQQQPPLFQQQQQQMNQAHEAKTMQPNQQFQSYPSQSQPQPNQKQQQQYASNPPTSNSIMIPTTTLAGSEIDKKLYENELMIEEWRNLFVKYDRGAPISPADALAHSQLRKRINENLAVLASHLKVFFATTKAEKERERENQQQQSEQAQEQPQVQMISQHSSPQITQQQQQQQQQNHQSFQIPPPPRISTYQQPNFQQLPTFQPLVVQQLNSTSANTQQPLPGCTNPPADN